MHITFKIYGEKTKCIHDTLSRDFPLDNDTGMNDGSVPLFISFLENHRLSLLTNSY